MLSGKPVSGGIGIGPAAFWTDQPATETPEVGVLADHQVEAELQRLGAAVTAAQLELQGLHAEADARLGPETAAILGAQLLMLEDPELVGRAEDLVRSQRLPAAGVLIQVGEALAELLAGLDDPYLRERAADVRDVTGRVVRHLVGSPRSDTFPEGSVLVAQDLPPSELLRLSARNVCALVLTAGGEASHTVILARNLGIPAVIKLGQAGNTIPIGATLVVDGDAGLVVVNPSPVLLADYHRRISDRRERQRQLAELRHLPSETRDGHRVQLAANVGSVGDAKAAHAEGAEGVGLFRTEFLFLDRSQPPSAAEQYAVYQEVLTVMAPHPVLIRTLDIGGDKPLPFLELPPEGNPFLGLRGIRFCQEYVPLFREQLRAILRAAAHGLVQVMVPMVSTRQEVDWVREQLDSVAAELRSEGLAYGEKVEVGIMVETPAAALMAAELAPLVDFFSIGTNDLTQYTMAVDRLNPRVAGLYDPYHPAVLRLVRMVVDGARLHGRWVGMCGELAGDPLATVLLLGLGLNELSMSSPQLTQVKHRIRSATLAEAKTLAEQALGLADGDAVRELLREPT